MGTAGTPAAETKVKLTVYPSQGADSVVDPLQRSKPPCNCGRGRPHEGATEATIGWDTSPVNVVRLYVVSGRPARLVS